MKACTELVYHYEVAGTLRFKKGGGSYGFSITREVTELIAKFTNVCGTNLRNLLRNIQNHPHYGERTILSCYGN